MKIVLLAKKRATSVAATEDAFPSKFLEKNFSDNKIFDFFSKIGHFYQHRFKNFSPPTPISDVGCVTLKTIAETTPTRMRIDVVEGLEIVPNRNFNAEMTSVFPIVGGAIMMTIAETEVTRSDAKVILVPANSNVPLAIASNPN